MHGEWAARVERDGFALIPEAVPGADIDALLAALSTPSLGSELRRRGGTRDLFESVSEVRNLARSGAVRTAAEAVLGLGCFAVRALLFDKTPEANWKVIWHQDLTIAVRERCSVEGFGPWSEKAGIPHVQPPTTLLERMVAVRLHLDDCGAENGPVRVLPGSHRAGRLGPEDIASWRERTEPVECLLSRGGLLVMRPLLLHASSSATAPVHRRVLHLEYAAESLPDGLEWHERW
ncbi:phytanoyl-CoA dioxygenase family protein [Vitiosangium sp. GDMCC 1.1324]|uniref:phytanoyl-CoA dioxygenase family protein n=1 Tax=Vitiosangium sp. (strain GDMCC 1.1324) TaxID=2138576 RepID=UPI000D35BEF0|nr:phytanoyl-CoA dioxygenase family protein [Vitiosangium sp. GDMCC 1.1324]PTL76753.1 phytanoyl-CoA dioxygenase [Vitiosangium sp. GDMCC 1.1324]